MDSKILLILVFVLACFCILLISYILLLVSKNKALKAKITVFNDKIEADRLKEQKEVEALEKEARELNKGFN